MISRTYIRSVTLIVPHPSLWVPACGQARGRRDGVPLETIPLYQEIADSNASAAVALMRRPGFLTDIRHLAQEVSTLARCQSENITQYYASVLKPGTSELLIVMELMAASVADLVRLA